MTRWFTVVTLLLFSIIWGGCGAELDGEMMPAGSETGASVDDGSGGDGPGFRAHYYSPWDGAFIHFDAGNGWTVVPGVEMQPEEGRWFVHTEEFGSGQVEFVFNDGADAWDNNGEMNYQTELQEFWVLDGVIYDEEPTVPDGETGPFCDEVDCGPGGTCNEEERRCDCDTGFVFDPEDVVCVEDKCATAACGAGELCDPDTGGCTEACTPDRVTGEFSFCIQSTTSTLAAVVRYDGEGSLNLGSSEVRLNADELGPEDYTFDEATQTFFFDETGLAPSKYSYLLRVRTDAGADVRPLFIPWWVGEGIRYADFTWKDGILYQIMTDRFLDGDPNNNLDNSQGTLAEVDDERSQWQGGDFAGITQKIRDGYFTEMGINALWISSPLLNSHNSQPAVGLDDDRRFSSYHSYHPIVTGYTHLDDFGYDNPIETAFGTPDELHELVRAAHERGIRIIPDFVANHVQEEARIYELFPEWFFDYVPCDGNWDAFRIECWFTTAMPDFDYSSQEAIDAVVDHAIWLIQEYNFDGFRADALKHMDDAFVRALKTAVVEQIETTVDDHSLSEETTVFYMVGESLGGWARYHVREDMVQGQVDEEYYNQTKAALLTYSRSIRDLANFAIANDTAYLSPLPTMGGEGGYPGAIMGNFFGNHDQWRALTEAQGNYNRLRLGQTFLFTSPGNVPMLYQGDDIGQFGEQDPDNRAMMRFGSLSPQEAESLDNARLAGKVREEHVALRRGIRETVLLEDYFWVYRVFHQDDEVYVAINRDADRSWTPPAGFTDALGNCAGGNVPSQTSCIFVAQ